MLKMIKTGPWFKVAYFSNHVSAFLVEAKIKMWEPRFEP